MLLMIVLLEQLLLEFLEGKPRKRYGEVGADPGHICFNFHRSFVELVM